MKVSPDPAPSVAGPVNTGKLHIATKDNWTTPSTPGTVTSKQPNSDGGGALVTEDPIVDEAADERAIELQVQTLLGLDGSGSPLLSAMDIHGFRSPTRNHSFHTNLVGVFDVDGDGDVDCCDALALPYRACGKLIGTFDDYVVGFPIISSVSTVLAWGAIAVQLDGFAKLFKGLKDLADLIGNNVSSLGPAVDNLRICSLVGVVVLNLAVASNGVLKWLQRIGRVHARNGAFSHAKPKSKSFSKRLLHRANSTIESGGHRCQRLLARWLRWCLLRGHSFALTFIATPLLWVLLLVQLLLSIAMACIFVLLTAVVASCESAADVQRAIESRVAATSGEDKEAALAEQSARQGEQAESMGNQMRAVDSSVGTNGFGDGITEFLAKGDGFSTRLTELCSAINSCADPVPHIFAGAVALVLFETIIIVRHHIFFERGFYEGLLLLRTTQLGETRGLLEAMHLARLRKQAK